MIEQPAGNDGGRVKPGNHRTLAAGRSAQQISDPTDFIAGERVKDQGQSEQPAKIPDPAKINRENSNLSLMKPASFPAQPP